MKHTLAYPLIFILTLLFVTQSFSQNTEPDVQVRLAFSGGKRVYRTGEPIRLALSFASNVDGYQLNTTTTKPASPIDEILVSPDAGVARWLDEYSGKQRYTPDYSTIQKISNTPIIVELLLNDSFRFDQQGKYTVGVKTSRVSRPKQPNDLGGPKIPLTTNEVSFEVVAMSRTEEDREVQRLSALLDATKDWRQEAKISEELSYLSGETSTREKVRRFLSSEGHSGNYSQNIHFGLFIALDRTLIVRLLEDALRDPNRPATHQLLHALIGLRLLQEGVEPAHMIFGQSQPPDQGQLRSAEIKDGYVRELAASLPKRPQTSRTTTAMTILGNMPQQSEKAAEMLVDVRAILLQEFDGLHTHSQEYLLSQYWDQLRDPSLKPALERILTQRREQQAYQLRTAALKRLMELDLDRAKPFVVTELRDPSSFVDLEVLHGLKDESLPEADAALLRQIRQLAPVKQNRDFVLLRQKALLAARFASPAIYDGLLEVYQTWSAKWEPDARAGILGYLARYNEAQALPLIEQALSQLGTGQDSSFLLDLTRSIYPPGIADLVRKRLESDDPSVVSSAGYIMSKRGPAQDLELVEARLNRWMKEWGERGVELDANGSESKAVVQSMVQVNLIESLQLGTNWKLPVGKIKQLKQNCATRVCRQHYQIR